MNPNPCPDIVLAENIDENVNKCPSTLKRQQNNLVLTRRQFRSRSEPNLYTLDLRPVILFDTSPIDENKENTTHNTLNTYNSHNTLNTHSNTHNTLNTYNSHNESPLNTNNNTPTKFLTVKQQFECSPMNMNMSKMMMSPSPTKLLFQRQWEGGRVKSPTQNELVEEALMQIRATIVSPRRMMLLPVMMNTSQPELNCLSSQTVADLVDGKFNHVYSKVMILDCRFDYEYCGGHIIGALNIPKEEDLEKLFIKSDTFHTIGEKLCLVFHCEFSSHRAPKAYKRLRAWDRKKHEACYPTLLFPEMYLLEGGYRRFFSECPDWCEPRGYVEMKDTSYLSECRVAMNRTRKSSRKFLSRSCTNIHSEEMTNKQYSTSDNMEEDLSG